MKRLMLLFCALFALESITAQVNPMEQLPLDPALRKGKLDNGLTYYIRHNAKPKGQADFYILHNVGAIQEEDTQQGLAHFLEHMAFNGTKNLPGKMLTEYLETVGVKFGYNLNAYTTWDRTVYNIADVPTKRQGIIDTAMLILHDWSHFISLEPKEIDSERGVIMEELRTRDGASWRSTISLIQALGKGTQYEHRNLIGYLDDLKKFQHKELESFYQKWYRPDYQAIVIVGDIDVDATEKKLKKLMKDIPHPAANAAKKEVIFIPDNAEPIINIYTDPEMSATQLAMFMKHEAMPTELNNTMQGVIIDVCKSMFGLMSNNRLQEIAMQPNAPFLSAGFSIGGVGICPTLEATTMQVVTKDGHLLEGYRAAYTELERIRRHGFTAGEYARAQENLLRFAEKRYTNRNDRQNGEYVQEYLDNYQNNTTLLEPEMEWQMTQALIQQIPVEAINEFVQEMIINENQVLSVNSPLKEGVSVPTEKELLKVRKEVLAAEIAPYVDNTVIEPLISEETKLEGSPVQTTTQDQLLGTTEWILKNGVKVIVKPTQFKADELRISGFAHGGLATLNEKEYYMGEIMPAVNSLSGVGKFSKIDLQKQLAGKSVNISIYADEYLNEISGTCSPKDVETMMQLLYLQFTEPRFNENDYNTLMNLLRSQLANIKKNPDYMMEVKKLQAQYNNHPLRQELSEEMMESFDFKQLPAIYKKLYEGINNYTFVFVGNIAPETLKPLVEKYIGSIPCKGQKREASDDGIRKVKGVNETLFHASMLQPKVSVYYDFTGENTFGLKEKVTMNFLAQALNARYLVSIREEKGGTYGVNVSGNVSYLPKPHYELEIMFDTNEEMADELMEAVMAEFKALAKNGPVSEDIEKHREFMLKQFKNGLEQNHTWSSYLTAKELNGSNYVADYEQAIRSVTNEDVQKMAQKILENNNMIKVVMKPESAYKNDEKK